MYMVSFDSRHRCEPIDNREKYFTAVLLWLDACHKNSIIHCVRYSITHTYQIIDHLRWNYSMYVAVPDSDSSQQRLHGWQLGESDLLCWPTRLASLVVLSLIVSPIFLAITVWLSILLTTSQQLVFYAHERKSDSLDGKFCYYFSNLTNSFLKDKLLCMSTSNPLLSTAHFEQDRTTMLKTFINPKQGG